MKVISKTKLETIYDVQLTQTEVDFIHALLRNVRGTSFTKFGVSLNDDFHAISNESLHVHGNPAHNAMTIVEDDGE